jgi:thioredoxin-related protein
MAKTFLSRRRWLQKSLPGAVFGLLSARGLTQTAHADSTDSLPFMANLSDVPRDLAAMQAQKIPMLLFVHASYCGFCHEVDNQFIQPMADDPAYRGRLIIRRIEIDADGSILDARGHKETNTEFARRLDVRLVPVVAFFAPDGQEVGERIKGITVPDFYPYYLDEGIKLAERCAKTPGAQGCLPPKPAHQLSL